MSENLDLVRSIFDTFARGDFASSRWADPQIEVLFADGPDPGQSSGLAAAGEAVRWRLSGWRDFRFEAEDIRELDPGRVLVLDRRSGHGKTSGMDVAQVRGKGAHIFEIRDGRVTRVIAYWDRARALADLGLEK